MDHKTEILALSAETLALNIIVGKVLQRLALVPSLRSAIREGFDEAANIAEQTAIVMGKTAAPEHTVKALRIVEELRSVVFGNEGEPKHGV